MITRRIIVNLVVFFGISMGLVAYGAVTLFGNPMREHRTLVADLPDAGGLRTGFSASHDGVVVGTVSKLSLRPHGVRVTVELDPGVTVPSGVEAKVVRASAVGEQRLDLMSTGPNPGKPLANGAHVPVAADPVPPDVADVLQTTNRLLDALPPKDLNTLVHELARSVDGRSGDLRAITRSLTQVNDDVVDLDPYLRGVLKNGPQVLDDFSAMSPEAHRALRNTDALTRILADRKGDLTDLLRNGGDLSTVADRVLLDDRASLTCFVGDLRVLSDKLQGSTLAALNRSLALNQVFFGAIDDVAVRGDAADVGYGPAQHDALWLRARLLVPPESPSASRYSPPRSPRPVTRGKACSNRFGSGSTASIPASSAGDRNAAGSATPAGPTATDVPRRNGPGAADTPLTATEPSLRPSKSPPYDTLILLALGAAILGTAAKVIPARTRRRTP